MEVVLTSEMLGGESEAEIKSWSARDGAEVKIGDLIVEIETGKAVVEVTAQVNGMLEILLPVGAIVGVNQAMARIT